MALKAVASLPRTFVPLRGPKARSIAIFALLIAPFICDAQAEGESRENDRQAVIAHLDQIYGLSLREGQAEELTDHQLKYFSSLPSIVPPGQEPIVGRDAVAAFYLAIFESIQILENSYEHLTIEIHGNTAVRRYLGSGKFRDGDVVIESKSQITDVLLKEDGQWRTVVHTWLPVGEPN